LPASACRLPGRWQAVRAASLRAVNLYTWDTYIGENTVADFTKAAGAGVNISLFANNDELFAKLRGGNQGYDVIVPSNDFVERMVAAGLLTELDHERSPTKQHRAAFLNAPFDPGRRVSMPYTWIVTGIGYRKSKVKGVPDSWKWVLDSDATRAASPCWRSERAVRDRRQVSGPPGQHQRPGGDRQVKAMLTAEAQYRRLP
jgi:spermidine/putrescine transport system substrate-binding protein